VCKLAEDNSTFFLFHNMMWLGVFCTPLDGLLTHSRILCNIKFAATNYTFYTTPGWREAMQKLSVLHKNTTGLLNQQDCSLSLSHNTSHYSILNTTDTVYTMSNFSFCRSFFHDRFGNRGFIITTAILLLAHFISTAAIIDYYNLNVSLLGGGENP